MVRESQSARTRLIKALQPQASRINFYRFCQLLEQSLPAGTLLGSDSTPVTDPIRFRPHPGMGFPVSELKTIEWDENQPETLPSVRTTFLGLYGVDSPLPPDYLDDITQQREGHEALEAFLDIFNHRVMTQFYRIWRKYAYPATFEKGGTDATSQCLLGLIGLGIPGTAEQVATPVSRFLALLGTMRLPTRTGQGIRALVSLLAPNTTVVIKTHDPVAVPIRERSSLSRSQRVSLSQRSVLGRKGREGNSRIGVQLTTHDPKEAQQWLPGGQLHTDFAVLMRVYLGYRCDARLTLTVPTSLLPEARLGTKQRLHLGRTGVLGLKAEHRERMPASITVNLGSYQGVKEVPLPPADSGQYRFR
ncbi:type VI secretion system baseplate subunit TssG [Xenorhabdus sp. 42]|uniref:type VI secretion system baseplate subunit TssG n=1 Tax=Xenorhabdus szentirmaii TaxID=290112 RepID=UPI001991B2BE|nr:type VI secretion system baseplate subunit TssG [Xenorhabdus sp. 42]MBD2822088.1 type VI secretion system baseplate subunit TssG [Xenorhabdus sp. 42]